MAVKFEVSFDWKGMYSHFFREQKEVQTRLDERQGFIMTQSPFWMFYIFRSMFLGVDESRVSRDVRTERIRRNVLENEGREVLGDNESGFHKLEDKAVQECSYSDESDEDEDSEADVSEEDNEDSSDFDSDD